MSWFCAIITTLALAQRLGRDTLISHTTLEDDHYRQYNYIASTKSRPPSEMPDPSSTELLQEPLRFCQRRRLSQKFVPTFRDGWWLRYPHGAAAACVRLEQAQSFVYSV